MPEGGWGLGAAVCLLAPLIHVPRLTLPLPRCVLRDAKTKTFVCAFCFCLGISIRRSVVAVRVCMCSAVRWQQLAECAAARMPQILGHFKDSVVLTRPRADDVCTLLFFYCCYALSTEHTAIHSRHLPDGTKQTLDIKVTDTAPAHRPDTPSSALTSRRRRVVSP
jgi:hypothetical protein